MGKAPSYSANRVLTLQGGAVVYAEGEVLTELPLNIGGITADLPVEVVSQKLEEIQQKATEMGTWMPDAHFSLTALTTVFIPFFRICEAGLMDIKRGELVDLIV